MPVYTTRVGYARIYHPGRPPSHPWVGPSLTPVGTVHTCHTRGYGTRGLWASLTPVGIPACYTRGLSPPVTPVGISRFNTPCGISRFNTPCGICRVIPPWYMPGYPSLVYAGYPPPGYTPSSRVHYARSLPRSCQCYRSWPAGVRSDRALGSGREILMGRRGFSPSGPQECDGWWDLCAQILPSS